MLDYKKFDVYVIDRAGKRHKIANRLFIASTHTEKLIGLIGQGNIDKGESLLLSHCNSIHMLFMKFPIDVLFIDKDMKIVKATKGLKPWKFDMGHPKSEYVLELPEGTLKYLDAVEGVLKIS